RWWVHADRLRSWWPSSSLVHACEDPRENSHIGYSADELYWNGSSEQVRDSVKEYSRSRRHQLDASERRMVELLQRDGRLRVAVLARDLGVTEVTARKKLKRLLGDGIIRIVATVDPFDVGYETP